LNISFDVSTAFAPSLAIVGGEGSAWRAVGKGAAPEKQTAVQVFFARTGPQHREHTLTQPRAQKRLQVARARLLLFRKRNEGGKSVLHQRFDWRAWACIGLIVLGLVLALVSVVWPLFP
jgi:hypothetical protein